MMCVWRWRQLADQTRVTTVARKCLALPLQASPKAKVRLHRLRVAGSAAPQNANGRVPWCAKYIVPGLQYNTAVSSRYVVRVHISIIPILLYTAFLYWRGATVGVYKTSQRFLTSGIQYRTRNPISRKKLAPYCMRCTLFLRSLTGHLFVH